MTSEPLAGVQALYRDVMFSTPIEAIDILSRALRLAASHSAVPAEPVAWERLNPTHGWIPVAQDDIERYRSLGQEIRALGVIATPPSTPDAAPVVRGLEFGWKCNCCGTVFTASKAKRDDDNEGGAKCPYCKAYGQYTYRYDLHEGDPCIHCDKLDTAVTITDEMVERGLAAAEKAAAEFTFSKEGVAEGFTFERSFTDEFKERFRAIHRAALAASLPSTGAPDENDGLELCGNFSATDPITDEDRLAYWKGAYERMAERNFRLNNALRQIRDHHLPFQPPLEPSASVDRVVRQYEHLRHIAKDAVED